MGGESRRLFGSKGSSSIFLPYERAQPGGVVGSVGLGLHVARVLARLMEGDLTYRHDGSDTVFELYLPLADDMAAAYTNS